jgi:hypothetical protein
MNEAETRAGLIGPARKAAGWGVVEASRVRCEAVNLGHDVGKPSSLRGRKIPPSCHIHGDAIIRHLARKIPRFIEYAGGDRRRPELSQG